MESQNMDSVGEELWRAKEEERYKGKDKQRGREGDRQYIIWNEEEKGQNRTDISVQRMTRKENEIT